MSMLSDTPQLKKRFPTWLLPAFGYASVSDQLDMGSPAHTAARERRPFKALELVLVALALIFEVAANFAHAWRWRLILRPAEDVPLWRCIQAVLIGLFTSEVLSPKAGEVIRGYLLTHWTKVHNWARTRCHGRSCARPFARRQKLSVRR